MVRLLGRLIAALFRRPRAPLVGTLKDERQGEFFTWFQLAERRAPAAPGGDGRTWHYFHPGGAAFQNLVKLDVQTAPDDEIVAVRLSLARSFVEDRRDSPFARDIAKSFLIWSLKHDPGQGAQPLIDNIAALAASGAPVIMRAGAAPPTPPADTTGGYAVYLGRRDEATLALTRTGVTLRNISQANGSSGNRWLTIDVSARV
jgi:hypothetical protein